MPLTCALLADYSHLLLLLSGDPGQDMALLYKAARACAGLAPPPVLLRVAEQAAAHTEPSALARRLGLIYLRCQADPEHCATTWAAAQPLLAPARDQARA